MKFLTGFLLSLTAAAPVSAAVVTLDAVNSGFYSQSGSTSSNGNYAAGYYGNGSAPPNVELRDYFVFDLSGLSGSITAATLHLRSAPPGFATYLSPDPSETFSLFDVSTAGATLTSGAGGVAAYTDLGTGTLLGSVVIPSSGGAFYDVVLNAAGIAYLQASSGPVYLGGAVTSLAKGAPNEAIFNATSAALTRQLIVTTGAATEPVPVVPPPVVPPPVVGGTVPEPPVTVLLLAGMLAAGTLRRFKR